MASLLGLRLLALHVRGLAGGRDHRPDADAKAAVVFMVPEADGVPQGT